MTDANLISSVTKFLNLNYMFSHKQLTGNNMSPAAVLSTIKSLL